VPFETAGLIAMHVLRSIVRRHFECPVEIYEDMVPADFHSLVLKAQDEINRRSFPRRLVNAMRAAVESYLGTAEIALQAELYLRAARPSQGEDIVSWHRESFYGAPTETVNLWIPVLNVTVENTLRYVPATADLPADAVETVHENALIVAKGSVSNRIGLLYAPKTIVGGVHFDEARPMLVPDGHAALFPGELVHGAGANRTDQIRFSVDLRLIAAEHVGKAKPGYFVPL
jgi:ectoine hydroxylase-related dioxygenase (phytanoyl-CoA dioxygenase family)